VKKSKTPQGVEVDKRLREVENVVISESEQDEFAVELDSTQLEKEAAGVPGGPRYAEVRKLPRFLFLPEPGYRAFAANTPGDGGFDPLGLCTDVTVFVRYREAELKHGRLAMVAALGWPLAELFEQQISEENLAIPDLLADTGGRMLPQLTGGTQDPFVEFFVALVIIIGSTFELFSDQGKESGDRSFDPLKVKGWSAPAFLQNLLPEKRIWMSEAEVQHSRLAMMAVLYDILDEILTGNPVVEDTEYLFHKIDARILSWQYWAFQPQDLESVSFPDATFPDMLM